MGDVFGWDEKEREDWNSPLNQVLLRVLEAFPEYLERDETVGKVTIRLK